MIRPQEPPERHGVACDRGRPADLLPRHLPRWQQLPPVRRRAILQRLHSLRNMTEEDRQSKLNNPAFLEGLSTEDREMLAQLAHLHVGMAQDTPDLK